MAGTGQSFIGDRETKVIRDEATIAEENKSDHRSWDTVHTRIPFGLVEIHIGQFRTHPVQGGKSDDSNAWYHSVILKNLFQGIIVIERIFLGKVFPCGIKPVVEGYVVDIHSIVQLGNGSCVQKHNCNNQSQILSLHMLEYDGRPA